MLTANVASQYKIKSVTTAKMKEERVKEKYVNAIKHVQYSSHSFIVCTL